MNNGLRPYTKCLKQKISDRAEGYVNVSQRDANVHIVLSLLETIGLNPIAEASSSFRFDFLYDEHGSLYGFVINSSYKHFYVRDSQGTILGIVDQTGNIVAKYSYTAYGKCTVTNINNNTIGTKNPFRFKGYYLDSESGMYYCHHRYYVPDWGRWLTPDSPGYLDPTQLNTFNIFSTSIDNGADCGIVQNVSSQASNFVGSYSSTKSSIENVSFAKANKAIRKYSSKEFPNTVMMTNYSKSLIENPLLAWILGNITHTITKQHNEPKTFYTYINTGNETSSIGVGFHIKDWYGLTGHISSNIGIGTGVQLGPLTLGAEISLFDGVSFSGGIVYGNVTEEFTFSLGCGPLIPIKIPNLRNSRGKASAYANALFLFLIELFD